MSIFEQFRPFRCLRLQVEVRAATRIELPSYLGSTLRGAFGMALRRSACALRRQECSTCLLRSSCIYSYTFETPAVNGTEDQRRYATAPHPFVLNLETGTEGIQEPGSTFSFGMTLVGRAADFLPYFVYAFQRMGELGIGKGRGTFELQRVYNIGLCEIPFIPPSPKGGRGDFTLRGNPAGHDGSQAHRLETIYEDGVLRMPHEFLGLREAQSISTSLAPQAVRLQFLTPLRLVFDGELCCDPQFHILARNLLRRLNNLVCLHCGQEADHPLGTLIDKAETVRLVDHRTRWYDWERYSKRQDKRMKLGGLLGEVSYEGDLQEFLPLLVLGSWVNMGKGTSFGLGRYGLETP
jgi:hypothetical protein